MAIKNSNVNPSGMVIRLKNGSPTTMRRSFNASTRRGKTVPSNTTNAKRLKTTLFAKNAPSRLIGESIAPGERSWSPRRPIKTIATTTMIVKKANNQGPTLPSLNACTLLMTPERVRKVPRIVKLKVAITKLRFQTRNIPRRS